MKLVMMKNKKAFTLIELLAVVIILSVLSFVAVPIMLSIIDEVRSSAKATSIANYAEAVRLSIREYQFNNGGELPPSDLSGIEIKTSNDNVSCETKYMQNANSVALSDCTVNGETETKYYYVSKKVYTDKDEFITKVTELGMEPDIFFPGISEIVTITQTTDSTPGVLSGSGTSASPYLIESIEDLVVLSNNVNAGNTYGGKYLSLTNHLDFDNAISYVDSTTTTYGDINGNGTPEGLLTELTTGKGFNPIGSDTKKFQGILLGNNKNINNLYISRSDTNYIGLFGYIDNGTIKKLNLSDVNVTGGDYTGALTGRTYQAYIYSINVKGDITGNNNTGGIIGYIDNYSRNDRGIKYSTVEGNISGADNVGGLVGGGYAMTAGYESHIYGINKGGEVTSTGTNVGRIVGWKRSDCIVNALAVKTVTINGSTVTNNTYNSINGFDVDSYTQVLSDINLADVGLDTYIGGDNDADGFYYDYNDNGILVVKNTTDAPLNFTFGTNTTCSSSSPCLINNYDELKKASQKQNGYYKMVNDIDLTNKKVYMLSTVINRWTGNFNGNNRTISNLTLNSIGNYIGLFGYVDNAGTIRAINLENINITGGYYTGGLAGFSYQPFISSISVEGNVTGKDATGGIIGQNHNYSSGDRGIKYVAFEGNVNGNDYVGGLVGYPTEYSGEFKTKIIGINKGGTIVSTGTHVGRISGQLPGAYNASSTLSVKTVTVNGLTKTSTEYTNIDGFDVDNYNQVLGDINLADSALDTYIGGDNDSDGFYYDYNDSNVLVLKNTIDNPLTFSLSGSGTSASPYLISSYEELKQASQKQNVYYKLTSDIDLDNKTFYSLSSMTNRWYGNFNGNNKTINNLSLSSAGNYVALFGYIDSGGTVKSVNLTNVDITGRNYTGGIAGYTFEPFIYSSNVQGSINGENRTGGIIGYMYTWGAGDRGVRYSTFEGNISGINYVGGLAGLVEIGPYSSYIYGINKGGTITSTGANIGRIVGYAGGGCKVNALALNTITLNGSIISNGLTTNGNGLNINSMDEVLSNINLADAVLDTYIGGDNDSDGYYYDYDDSEVLIIKNTTDNPLTFSLSGNGDSASPYLITSLADWKQTNLKLTSTYQLTTSVDYINGTKYALGSSLNPFTGQIIDTYHNNNSIYFDGSNDYISIPRMIADDFTIEFQFKSTVGGPSTSVNWYDGDGLVDAEQGGVTNDFGTSFNSNGQVLAGTGNPDRSIYSDNRYKNGAWHYVRLTRQKATGKVNLYIDNTIVSSMVSGTQSLNAPSYINIGRMQTGINYFNGYIKNIRIWDSVTSSNMSTDLTGGESNLKAYYKFNEGTGTVLTDYTSNGYNGTIYGSPVWN